MYMYMYVAIDTDVSVCVATISAVSGLVSATMGTPADVIKTRMMSQAYDQNNRGLVYSSSLNCLLSTVSAI